MKDNKNEDTLQSSCFATYKKYSKNNIIVNIIFICKESVKYYKENYLLRVRREDFLERFWACFWALNKVNGTNAVLAAAKRPPPPRRTRRVRRDFFE